MQGHCRIIWSWLISKLPQRGHSSGVVGYCSVLNMFPPCQPLLYICRILKIFCLIVAVLILNALAAYAVVAVVQYWGLGGWPNLGPALNASLSMRSFLILFLLRISEMLVKDILLL